MVAILLTFQYILAAVMENLIFLIESEQVAEENAAEKPGGNIFQDAPLAVCLYATCGPLGMFSPTEKTI